MVPGPGKLVKLSFAFAGTQEQRQKIDFLENAALRMAAPYWLSSGAQIRMRDFISKLSMTRLPEFDNKREMV